MSRKDGGRKYCRKDTAAEELKPIEGEEYVAEEAPSPEEVRS
jgi:hypothetical protein